MRAAAIAIAIAAMMAGSAAVAAEPSSIASRQRAQKTHFTDAQIVDGFFKTAFGAEFHLAGRVDRIRKYDGPVRVFAESSGRPDRRPRLARIVADIAAKVQHLDIAMAAKPDAANVTVRLVRDRDLTSTLSGLFGKERAREIKRSLDPQCLSAFRKDEQFSILHSDVVLTIDNGEAVFLDCAYEELLQSLGPINDTSSVPWTMFNDDVAMGFFDVYDQYVLNVLYHPLILPGMTVADVKAVLPQVLPDVRAFVAKVNGLRQE